MARTKETNYSTVVDDYSKLTLDEKVAFLDVVKTDLADTLKNEESEVAKKQNIVSTLKSLGLNGK